MDNFILLDWGSFTLFLLIAMRMVGFVSLNPLFSREGVLSMTQGGFALILAVLVFSVDGGSVAVPNTNLQLMFMMLSELIVGMVFSMVMNFFFSVVAVGGNAIDMQMGFSMAQAYDPGSGATLTVSANFLNALLVMVFFAENGHHTLVRLMITSGDVVPYGGVFLGDLMVELMVQVFAECMVLALKLTMPILAAELLGQVGMGVLMKAIPQINVFVINIDLKVIIGLCLMVIFMPVMSDFMLQMEMDMLDYLQKVLITMVERDI